MCGIILLTGAYAKQSAAFANIIVQRGPDDTKILSLRLDVTMIFHRLAIRDTTSAGMQPFIIGEPGARVVLMCNGEIYNYQKLKERYDIVTASGSDCEVLLHMYIKFGGGSIAIRRMCCEVDAEFALVIFDERLGKIFVARDFGIRPLFYTNDIFCCASEMKALLPTGRAISPFPPRCYMTVGGEPMCYWYFPTIPTFGISHQEAKNRVLELLTESVSLRLNSDRPIGMFLSGGLDSSIIVSIACRLLGDASKVHTFSVGIKESPDLIAARKVSEFLGTKHTEVLFTPEEGASLIEDIIRCDETYDTTTIRASVPQYILSKWIKENTDIRVVLSGEGSDEIFMGYLMWYHSPSPEESQRASLTLCENLYMYDCLRSDRTTAAHGLEVRVPFLSRELVDYVLGLPPSFKEPRGHKMEKMLLRDAFQGYLPHDILYRTKAAFSDAVGYEWIEYLKKSMPVRDVANSSMPRPRTREERYYRHIFDIFFPLQRNVVLDYWRQWWSDVGDPSARFLECYKM
jgi:asparagine synthase (glutamine-hydrolysing)